MATQKIDNTFIVSEAGDTLKTVLEIDPTDKNSTSGLGRFRNIKISNPSIQPIEVHVFIKGMYNSGADNVEAGGSPFVVSLKANESITLPHSKLFNYQSGESAGFKDGTSGAFINPPSTGVFDVGVNTSAAYSLLDTTITVADSDYFKVNDFIKIDSEIFLVTSITTGVLTVEHSQLGTTNATHSSGSDIYFYFLNESGDGFCKTNGKGYYSATNFFGKARNSDMPMGLVPGSVALRFYEPSYQEFGMSDQTSNTDSGLTASTSYSFNITPDYAASATQIDFIVDATNTNWGSSNGILEKINAIFLSKWKDGTFTYLPTISLFNGDIRVTSGSKIFKKLGTTAGISRIVLADPTTGTTPFGVKRVPTAANLFGTVEGKAPGDAETSKMMFDDGNGNLSSSIGGGKINYETGAIEFTVTPNTSFEYCAYWNSALSGEPTAERDNYIRSISAKSLNPFREGYVRIELEDIGVDDSTSSSLPVGSYR